MANAGFCITFTNSTCKAVSENGSTIIEGQKIGRLYQVTVQQDSQTALLVKKTSDMELLLRRLGHLGISGMKLLLKEEMVLGININGEVAIDFCDVCEKGKMSERPFPTDYKLKSSIIGKIIHSDVCEPF